MEKPRFPAYAQTLCSRALEMGAAHALPFAIGDIAFDERVLMKCMFGCPDWGKFHTCPSRPGYPSMPEWRRMLERYAWGVVVHTHDAGEAQRITLALEGQAFRDGYYMAFSTSDCNLCETCTGREDAPCRFPEKARPAFHAVGVDVVKTVRGLGLSLSFEDRQLLNWYAAVWVE